MKTAPKKPRKPRKTRAERIAAKVLSSDGFSPARLQAKDGNFWTLQWAELTSLARATLTLTGKGRKEGK